MNYNELYAFSQATTNAVQMMSYSSYYDFDYSLELADCTTGAAYLSNKDVDIPNPHPSCTDTGSIKITGASYDTNGNLNIAQTVNNAESYTCSIVDVTGTISHDGFGSESFDTSIVT
jgi:hypothetical protein